MTSIATIVAAICLTNAPAVGHSESIELIGFSKLEDAAAFRVRVAKPAPLDRGDTDRFTVIRVVNVESGEIIGHFRQGKIKRVDKNGKRVRLASRDQVSADNPMWLNAFPAKKWQQVRRKVGFRYKRVDAKAGAIRLEAGGRAKMHLEADEKAMVITSEPGGAIHVTPRAHLWNGKETTLSAVRVRGVDGRVVRATLRFFHSPSGHTVASHIRLTSDTPGHEQTMDFTSVHRMPDAPLAVTSVGTWNMMKENHASAQGLWDDMHPETKNLYKAYVGTWGDL